jgi:hypothetical protein
MDRRKIYLENQQTFYESLNNRDLNLEIAKNIEHLTDMREVIRIKAIQTYEEARENRKIFTISTNKESLDDKPKLIYIIFLAGWYLLYRRGLVNKISFLWGLCGLSIVLNLRRQYYCKMQKEYEDYVKLNENLKKVITMKKKSFTSEILLNKLFGIKYTGLKDDLKIIKYEYLF